jgi:predicted dinucleotide-binding enzyme
MRIAIIGSGNVGGTLGRRFLDVGHDVAFGVRDGSTVKGTTPLPTTARVTAPRDAVADADLIILAVPAKAVPDVLQELGATEGALDGRILVDSTNVLGPGMRPVMGPQGESGGERVQAIVPKARVVKAFNTTGFGNMANPVYGDRASVMFVAGDDAEARTTVVALAASIGFDALDAGALVRARELEHLAALWISLSMNGHGREIAFALLRR